jgi:hypothetical protein
VPRGVHINFLKAERSLHRWALEDLQRIHTAEELAADEGGGVEMHLLEDAGHWVCTPHRTDIMATDSFLLQWQIPLYEGAKSLWRTGSMELCFSKF